MQQYGAICKDCGFVNDNSATEKTITQKKTTFKSPTLHTKYVDDLTILEAINLKEALIPNPVRTLPDSRVSQKT